VIFRFVVIGGIDDHQCLSFIFTIEDDPLSIRSLIFIIIFA